MEKEKITTTIVIILCMLAIAIFGFGKYFAIIPLDDYVIFDDFSEGVIEFPNVIDNIGLRQTGYATFWNDKYKVEYETLNFQAGCPTPPNPCRFITDITLPVIINGEFVMGGEWCGNNCHIPK